MKKLYVVKLFKTVDGWSLLGESIYEKARDARNEFLRVRDTIFTGYHNDTPDEYGYRVDRHFTEYETGDLLLLIEVVQANKAMECYADEETYRTMDMIEDIFDEETESASIPWSYDNGFKIIHDRVKRCLYDSFVKCNYEDGKMKYYVHSEEGKDVIIAVCKNDSNMEYSWHYEQ